MNRQNLIGYKGEILFSSPSPSPLHANKALFPILASQARSVTFQPLAVIYQKNSVLSRLLLLLQPHLALPVTTSPWPTEPETEEPGVLAPVAKCHVYFLFYLVSTVGIYEANGRCQPSLWTPSPSLSLPINASFAVTRYLLYPDPRCFQSRSRD